MANPIDISIVIVSWNVSKLLEDCLNSIFLNSEGLSLEVFVVDNASTDDTVQMVTKKFPDVKIIANEKNIGFSKPNRFCSCSYFL